MASSQPVTRLERPEWIERRLRAHEEEVARLREEFGDPQHAPFVFTRDRLDRESLLGVAQRDGDWPATEEDDDETS
jgi:trehalose-6-phosphate synthase